MTMRMLIATGLGSACLLMAAESPNKRVQTSHTDHMDFPAGGTLRMANSVGVLTVETWSQPDMEITTVKSTKTEIAPANADAARKALDKIQVNTERKGNEVVISTAFHYRPFPPPYPRSKDLSVYPFARDVSFDLEYHIKIPAGTRIVVDHAVGEVNIDGAPGDVQATLTQGEIMLHLPQDEHYEIHASSRWGHVDNDFAGEQKRRAWLLGHRADGADPMAHHKLDLNVRFGNIVILKMHSPQTPDLTASAAR